MDLLHIQPDTGFDGFQKKRHPYVGSTPFRASLAADMACWLGLRRQTSPLVTDSKACGWNTTPDREFGNLLLETLFIITAATAN